MCNNQGVACMNMYGGGVVITFHVLAASLVCILNIRV